MQVEPWLKIVGAFGAVLIGIGVFGLSNTLEVFHPDLASPMFPPILIGVGAHFLGMETGILLQQVLTKRRVD